MEDGSFKMMRDMKIGDKIWDEHLSERQRQRALVRDGKKLWEKARQL